MKKNKKTIVLWFISKKRTNTESLNNYGFLHLATQILKYLSDSQLARTARCSNRIWSFHCFSALGCVWVVFKLELPSAPMFTLRASFHMAMALRTRTLDVELCPAWSWRSAMSMSIHRYWPTIGCTCGGMIHRWDVLKYELVSISIHIFPAFSSAMLQWVWSPSSTWCTQAPTRWCSLVPPARTSQIP